MKKIIAMMLALLMAMTLIACGEKAPVDDEGEAGNEKTTLVMGTSADYAPYEFMYPDANGNMIYGGIDISVAQAIADSMEMELEVQNMNFDFLLNNLQQGKCDMVLAAIEATPDRLESADFSDPYYTDLPKMIVVPADQAAAYKTLKDFGGKLVGAQTATTNVDIVTNDMEGAQLNSQTTVTDMFNMLANGKLDAVVVDGAIAMQYVENNKTLAIADASGELGEALPYCVAVAKGDPQGLLEGINAAIADMVANKKVEQFIADADKLADVAVEVAGE
ncbi:MAG: transporter substrate-binding domain-containing protein [Oscillospiraceae bacterium]|nr:transporter substrate-binding domain-containing protein [Oscillospiraceae bacterium]